jgi:peptidoglycan/LPS O-acetylase OafA/YrhL
VRNRYLDLLRAAAIVRVIVYHLFGWPWLSIMLPAMGIMFALAGSLTAASLDKRSAGRVISSRLRRLLPPLWLLAVIAVPAMLALGWNSEVGGDEPVSWKLGLWLLPIGDPPGSRHGIDAWEPLWYIRAYLWFVVLSPLLYPAYKKIGWAAVAAPIVLIAVLDKTDVTLPFGRADAAMWDFATYGACWIAGFAHHDGRLARIRPGLVVAASAALGLAALYWLRGHPPESGWDLNDVSESQALWSLAFVLLALRWQPDMTWLQRSPRLNGAVNLLNARAVTIYLWHNIAIAAIWPVLTVLTLDDLGRLDAPTDLIASLALTLVAVLAFGWVEDLAARRRPALWPTGAGGGRGEADAPPTGRAPVRSQAGAGPWDFSPPSTGEPGAVGTGRYRAPDPRGPSAGHRPAEAARPSDAGGAADAPWARAGVAPIVMGESGPVSRRRDYVAPFPEAEVSFGLPPDEGPEAGAGLGAGEAGSP